MIISRTIAKRRIAAGMQPSLIEAWGLVVADFVLVALIFGGLGVLLLTWYEGGRVTIEQSLGGLFFLCFLPSQLLLFLSSLWAVKSRAIEVDAAD